MNTKKLDFYKLAIKENKSKTLKLLEEEFIRENITMSELISNFNGFEVEVLEDETVKPSDLRIKFENAKDNFVKKTTEIELLKEELQTTQEALNFVIMNGGV